MDYVLVLAKLMSPLGFVSAALGFSLLLSGCSGDRRLRLEARAFLAVYDALDHRDKPEHREEKLTALRQLVLVEPEVAETRDHCVAGHAALLKSERTHEEAAKKLDEALAHSPEGAALSPQATEQIRTQIAQAESALSDARVDLKACENKASGLALRFGKP